MDIDKETKILLNKYSSYTGENVCEDLIETSPFSIFLLHSLFFKIDRDGKLDEIERRFLIDYMKCGLMNKDEILDYEDLRINNPQINLPSSMNF